MKLPSNFYKPLAIGAPQPVRELPVRPERMIHFFPPHVEKLRARAPDIANQIDIAKRVFSPNVGEVLFAKRILEAMPDGSGVAMIDGKMRDDATWKQAKVIVDPARLVAERDPDLAKAYEF